MTSNAGYIYIRKSRNLLPEAILLLKITRSSTEQGRRVLVTFVSAWSPFSPVALWNAATDNRR